jgi:hypothetical protein
LGYIDGDYENIGFYIVSLKYWRKALEQVGAFINKQAMKLQRISPQNTVSRTSLSLE